MKAKESDQWLRKTRLAPHPFSITHAHLLCLTHPISYVKRTARGIMMDVDGWCVPMSISYDYIATVGHSDKGPARHTISQSPWYPPGEGLQTPLVFSLKRILSLNSHRILIVSIRKSIASSDSNWHSNCSECVGIWDMLNVLLQNGQQLAYQKGNNLSTLLALLAVLRKNFLWLSLLLSSILNVPMRSWSINTKILFDQASQQVHNSCIMLVLVVPPIQSVTNVHCHQVS